MVTLCPAGTHHWHKLVSQPSKTLKCCTSFDRHGFYQHPSSLLDLGMSNLNSVSKKNSNILPKNSTIASKDRHFETRSLHVHVCEESWGSKATSFSWFVRIVTGHVSHLPRHALSSPHDTLLLVSTKGRNSWFWPKGAWSLRTRTLVIQKTSLHVPRNF